jgi:uncharacterized protein
MKIKTQSGVDIMVEPTGSSRIVFFNKPIRTIELDKDESLQVSSFLVDGINTEVAMDSKRQAEKEILIEPDMMRILTEVEREAKRYMEEHHFSGHDFAHVLRVQRLCKAIGERENADMPVLLASALLHDLGRDHERKNPAIDHAEKSAEIAEDILRKVSFPSEKIPAVVYAIKLHRFSNGATPTTLEAKILQDADRIDISGAVGIATTFAFGGAHNSEMYKLDDPFAENRDLEDSSYTLDHFYAKLLYLSETMHTKIGREIADRRRRFMQCFLEQFKAELEGTK